jgi:hypothetical protein
MTYSCHSEILIDRLETANSGQMVTTKQRLQYVQLLSFGKQNIGFSVLVKPCNKEIYQVLLRNKTF